MSLGSLFSLRDHSSGRSGFINPGGNRIRNEFDSCVVMGGTSIYGGRGQLSNVSRFDADGIDSSRNHHACGKRILAGSHQRIADYFSNFNRYAPTEEEAITWAIASC